VVALNFKGASESLVAKPVPGWAVRVPLRPSPGRLLELICDDGAEPPVRVAREGCELVFEGVLYDNDPAVFGGVVEGGAAAERVLDAYLRQGTALLPGLEGMFSFVLCDNRDNPLCCARDRIGLQPFFYAETGQDLVCSTSVDALARRPEVSSEVNFPLVAERLLGWSPCPGDETAYLAIKRLPPARALSIRDGAVSVSRYWDPFPAGREIEWIREDAFERVDELLAQAVVRCLRLGPTGIFLSGGVDSCTVAVIAADESRTRGFPPPAALSLIFPIGEQDERIQRGVATALDLDLVASGVEEIFSAGGIIETALATSAVWPHPLWSPWQPAYQYLGVEARRLGCRALLSGDGGDEQMLVHDLYAADRLRALDFPRFYRFWKGKFGAGSAGRLAGPASAAWLWRATVRPLVRELGRATTRRISPRRLGAYRERRAAELMPDWFAPDPALRRELTERALMRAAAWDGFTPYVAAHRQPFDNPEAWSGHEELYEIGRRLGLRYLTPFWDSQLVELLARTPPELLVQGGYKGPARHRLANRFPGLGFEEPGGSYTDRFLERLMASQGTEAWKTLEGVSALSELGIADSRRLVPVVERAFAGRSERSIFDIWTVLSVESWLRTRILRR
jgi:asparagine synthetase B (glutamine-hydrolysing)